MSLYLCVDCGGSKTSAVICDAEGKILGRALGGPSNFAYLSLEAFVSAVKTAVGNALKTCTSLPSNDPVALPPISLSPFAAAWFGVSGVDSPSAVAAITPAISELLGIPAGPRLAIANDTHLLAAPVRMYKDISHAVAVIGGTGSIAVTFSETAGQLQELGRIGGWGWVLGDEGGGFNIGREAVRQILLEYDTASITGIPPPSSKFKTQVLEMFGVTEVMDVLTAVHFSDPSPSTVFDPGVAGYKLVAREKRLSSLSPIVFSAAMEDADPLALNVLRTCAGLLAAQIAVLLGECDDRKPRLVKAQESVISFGGSLVGIKTYRDMILDDLAKRGHVFKYVQFIEDAAAVGAVGLAAGHQQMDKA